MLKCIFKIFKKEKQATESMKYLIVGLGNMHPDYEGTRHNIGFDVIDQLAGDKVSEFKHENLGDILEIKYRGRILVLLKPSTYMNRSGKAVRYWLQKKKIKLNNLLVVVDDVNLDFGAIRLRNKGSDGGHNGLKDIQAVLQTTNYPRLRVGIGNNFGRGQKVDFVLGKWTEQEKIGLSDILKKSSQTIQSFCFRGLAQTMNLFNKA
jgi:PTH1 family peptidyl-tRNA hydrolase